MSPVWPPPSRSQALGHVGTEYEVVITKGRIGFPRGVWTTLNYRAMAEAKVESLRQEGITAKVREKRVKTADPSKAAFDYWYTAYDLKRTIRDAQANANTTGRPWIVAEVAPDTEAARRARMYGKKAYHDYDARHTEDLGRVVKTMQPQRKGLIG